MIINILYKCILYNAYIFKIERESITLTYVITYIYIYYYYLLLLSLLSLLLLLSIYLKKITLLAPCGRIGELIIAA